MGILGFKDLIDVMRTWMMFCTNFGEVLCQGFVLIIFILLALKRRKNFCYCIYIMIEPRNLSCGEPFFSCSTRGFLGSYKVLVLWSLCNNSCLVLTHPF